MSSTRRQYVETNGSLMIALPKLRAGVRTVAFPATLVPELREHLDTYAEPDITALVFTGQRGGVLRGATSARPLAGLMPWPRSGCPGCIFMICGTPETR